jgi:hypothetical protein
MEKDKDLGLNKKPTRRWGEVIFYLRTWWFVKESAWTSWHDRRLQYSVRYEMPWMPLAGISRPSACTLHGASNSEGSDSFCQFLRTKANWMPSPTGHENAWKFHSLNDSQSIPSSPDQRHFLHRKFEPNYYTDHRTEYVFHAWWQMSSRSHLRSLSRPRTS